jgi:hypothetical protein
MSTIAEIQSAVEQLSPAEKYELSKWLLQQVEPEPLTEEVTDAIALERFLELDNEERAHAEGSAR